MLCPACGISLRHVQKDGVTVGLCLKCCGLWLKRGELKTLVEREASELALAFREADIESDGYFRNSSSSDGATAAAPKKRKGVLESLSELTQSTS